MVSAISLVRFPALVWTVSRARAAVRTRRWADAAALYQKVVALAPANAGEWVQYGHALKESGDLAGAETAYRRAVRLAPHTADPHRQLGFLLKRADRSEEATASFVDGLAVAPAAADLGSEVEAAGFSGPDLNARLIVAALAIGEPSPAEQRQGFLWFRAPRLRLAVAAADRASAARDWPKAEAGYRAVLSLDPLRPAIHVQLGHSLKEQGNLKGAVSAYRQAISLAPHLADPHLHLGHALKLMKDREGAIASYANAWRLQPGFGDVERELRDYAGWSADTMRNFGIDSWSTGGGEASTSHRRRAKWAVPAGLDARETQVWGDLTFALER